MGKIYRVIYGWKMDGGRYGQYRGYILLQGQQMGKKIEGGKKNEGKKYSLYEALQDMGTL